MSADKEILNDFKENYAKVRKLIDENSKHDLPSEPYFSKYAARAILVHMKHSADSLLSKHDDENNKVNYIGILGSILLNIGMIDMDTEEVTEGEKILSEAVLLLEPYCMEREIIVTLVSIYNHLGVFWSNRDNIEKTKHYLFLAKDNYIEFKTSGKTPFSIDYIFGLVSEDHDAGWLALEKVHTLTLYYIAQLYGTLKENLNSALYCHMTLKRQLEFGDFDAIDWALNAATLSQFFAEQSGFVQSRHHLAAASLTLRKHETELLGEVGGTEDHDARVEIWKHRSADVARCWAKYCLMLLAASKVRLMTDAEFPSDITDLSNMSIEDRDESAAFPLSNLKFPGINVSEFEDKITANYLLTYDDARKVFLECQNWLNKSKEYYKLDTLASDHIEIVQDNSQAYLYLIFFEDDDERQAKMHKRRINMLEELLHEINPTYYMQYCRQLWYELGEAYSDILNLKLDKLKNMTERPNPQSLKKINSLCQQSIEKFDSFLNSVKNSATEDLPDKLESDLIRPTLTAYALIARNYMKIITPDKCIQKLNCVKSLDAYKAVVDYCAKDEDASKIMNEELSLCKEMVNILPLKIKKLEGEISSQ